MKGGIQNENGWHFGQYIFDGIHIMIWNGHLIYSIWKAIQAPASVGSAWLNTSSAFDIVKNMLSKRAYRRSRKVANMSFLYDISAWKFNLHQKAIISPCAVYVYFSLIARIKRLYKNLLILLPSSLLHFRATFRWYSIVDRGMILQKNYPRHIISRRYYTWRYSIMVLGNKEFMPERTAKNFIKIRVELEKISLFYTILICSISRFLMLLCIDDIAGQM